MVGPRVVLSARHGRDEPVWSRSDPIAEPAIRIAFRLSCIFCSEEPAWICCVRSVGAAKARCSSCGKVGLDPIVISEEEANDGTVADPGEAPTDQHVHAGAQAVMAQRGR